MRKKAQAICAVILLAALSACSTGPRPWWDGGPATPNSGVYAVPMPPPGRGGSITPDETVQGGGGNYVVRAGDTVYKISRENNVPLRSLIEANNLQPPYNIRTGQRLRIPTGRFYTVQRGDTVYSISRKYSVDTTTLTQLNRIPSPYTIKVGQRLQLPSQFRVARRADDVPPQRPSSPSTRPANGSVAPSTKTPLPAPPIATGNFIWPAQGKIVSRFGPSASGLHNDGINIAVPSGAAVKASQSGVVAYAGNELKGYGNLLLIRHADGWMTAYAHNSKLLVQRGQQVTRGQTIAQAGSTGSVTSPQVHFEIRKGSKAVDPLGYLGG